METKATIPRTSPEEAPIWIKERVITKRKKTKLCALKLHWRLAKEGVDFPTFGLPITVMNPDLKELLLFI